MLWLVYVVAVVVVVVVDDVVVVVVVVFVDYDDADADEFSFGRLLDFVRLDTLLIFMPLVVAFYPCVCCVSTMLGHLQING